MCQILVKQLLPQPLPEKNYNPEPAKILRPHRSSSSLRCCSSNSVTFFSRACKALTQKTRLNSDAWTRLQPRDLFIFRFHFQLGFSFDFLYPLVARGVDLRCSIMQAQQQSSSGGFSQYTLCFSASASRLALVTSPEAQ